ncbi:MAG TPA: DUF6390 family protein [Acidimicrobiales bacterium]|nr:DUF6390 family protein [Acidimicrobiales bacterium]
MTPGPLLFARYAAPPNSLGYCGPADPAELTGAAAGWDLRGVTGLARQFEGAWPYLELIAGCNGIADPLDHRVVDAYWVGNRLLDRVGAAALVSSLDERFRRRAGSGWEALPEAARLGGAPHHSFHVFAVYPWLGMLRAGGSEAPLRVLDLCRIRWGRVVDVVGDTALVTSRGLAFDGHRLGSGAERTEVLRVAPAVALGPGRLSPGDAVSLHWDWVCDRLSDQALARLRRYTALNLAVANSLRTPGPAAVLDRLGG